ncbi:hypothetical protein ACW95P_03160 [Candidatus Mycoplasma pogonae]
MKNDQIKMFLNNCKQEVLSLAFYTKRSHAIKATNFIFEKSISTKKLFKKILAIFLWLMIFTALGLISYYLIDIILQFIVVLINKAGEILTDFLVYFQWVLTIFNFLTIIFFIRKKFSNKKYRGTFLLEFQQGSQILVEKINLVITNLDKLNDQAIQKYLREIQVMLQVFIKDSNYNIPFYIRNKWILETLFPTNQDRQKQYSIHVENIKTLITKINTVM